MTEWPITSSAGQRMLTYLPRYYETSRVMRSVMDADGSELDLLQQAFDETLQQLYVQTATWGLDLWEAELGIGTDREKPISQRRSAIISKIRGTGTVTIELIQNVAQAYEHGTVTVKQQPALYQFTVQFVDTLGLPPNLDDLKDAIEDIKPAHLAVQYSFRYLSISEIQGLTIDQIQAHKMTDFSPFLKEG